MLERLNAAAAAREERGHPLAGQRLDQGGALGVGRLEES